jgi:perosamine synthetase
VGVLEKRQVRECLASGFISTYGPFVARFEEKFSEFLGVKRAVSLQSGTAGLHMALLEMGLQPGQEVILPACTFAASVNPVLYLGAVPVLVDINPLTWTMDPTAVEAAITPRTRAIMAVHLYGNPCNLGALRALAAKYRLLLIEDATESLGSRYRGKFTGTWGEMGVFSFNGNKLITTGGGGMVVGRSQSRLKHMGELINQAKDARRPFWHREVGYNYRMTNLEASLGLAQLSRIGKFLTIKNRIRDLYAEAFREVEEIRLQEPQAESAPVWWLSSLRFNTSKLGLPLEAIQARLKEKGVPSRRIFRPLGDLPPYRSFLSTSVPRARRLFADGLSLPSSTRNREIDIRQAARIIVDWVAEQLSKKYFQTATRRSPSAAPLKTATRGAARGRKRP